MSQRIPRAYRYNDEVKDKLLCTQCKFLLTTCLNMPKWKCGENNWSTYDTKNNKCKFFIKRKNLIVYTKKKKNIK